MTGKLCIVNDRFGVTSQTFIVDHLKNILPGRTVRLSVKPDTQEEKALSDVPHLVVPDQGAEAVAKGLAFLKQHDVEAILFEFGPTALNFEKLIAATDIKCFVHFHGYDASKLLKRPRYVRRIRRVLQNCEEAFTPSEYIRTNLQNAGLADLPIGVTPCGIEASDFSPSKRIEKSVLAVGRFVEKKSPNLAILAFAEALRVNPDLKLDYVGDGPLFDSARFLASELGVADRIQFHGSKPRSFVQERLLNSSIFIQHSITSNSGDAEGLPVAILEAMCSEIPVVSTFHSGIPEAVIDGKTGFLVQERDFRGMGKAIAKLSEQPNLAKSMGEAGRCRVLENFTHQTTAESLRKAMFERSKLSNIA